MTENQLENKVSLSSFTDLLKKSWEIFKAKWEKILSLNLITFAIGFLCFILTIIVLFAMNIGSLAKLNITKPGDLIPILSKGEFLMPLIVFFVVLWLVYMFLTVLFQISLIYIFDHNVESESIFSILNKATKMFIPFSFVGFLAYLVIIAGTSFLIIPGIILAIGLTFTSYIVVLENEKGINTLSKASLLIKNYKVAVFTRFFLLGLGLAIINGISQNLLNLLSDNSPYLASLFSIIEIPINFIVYSITPIFTFVLYKNLKDIKGELSLDTKSNQKTKYILLAVWGCVVVVGVSALLGSLVENFSQEIENLDLPASLTREFENLKNNNSSNQDQSNFY